MAIRNAVPDYEFGVPKGMDTTSPIATVREGFVRDAKNSDVGLAGGYTKRMGYANQVGTPYGSRSITAGIEYKNAAGTSKTILFGTTGLAGGGRYGVLSAGAVTDITTGLSGTVRPTFIQFDDRLFFYNGSDTPELYNGTATRQIGITAPVAAPTVDSQTTTGELTLLSTYIYAYTYYNSTTGAESSPSPLSDPETLTGANNKIVLDLVAGDSATADEIRVYRTVGFGNVLFYDGSAAISATSYESTVSDAGLGTQIEFDNSRITDLAGNAAKYPTVADQRVFLKTANNEIRFSKIGQSGPMPESFEAKAVASTMGTFGAGDDIVGTNRISQLVIVLKNQSIGRLDPIGLPDLTSAFDNVAYQYREISDTTGAVSHWASCQVLGELIFLGKDNIYATDGIRVRPIADTIQATIRGLGFSSSQVEKMSAINDTDKRRVEISVFSTSNATNPDMVLVGDYQMYPEFRWTYYTQGDNTTTHPGIKAGSFFYVTNTSTGKKEVWFGNSSLNGKAYKLNSTNADDGSAIFFKIVTRPYFGGSPLTEKLYKKATIQGKGDGNDYDLTVGAIFNLTGAEEGFSNLDLFANAALYDASDSLYDTSLYADEAVKTLEYDMHRKANYLQLVFKQTEASAPVDLFAWGVAASGHPLRNRFETT